MQTPSVPLDVLHIIFSLLSIPELVNISVASKLCHTLALKRILSSNLLIDNNARLTGFCACVLVDAPVRAAWIKSLEIEVEAFQWDKEPFLDCIETTYLVDTSSVSGLTSVLRYCHGLTSLSIPALVKLVEADSQLRDSIISLPNLKELTLPSLYESPLIEKIVSEMRSQLRVLRMWCNFEHDWLDIPLLDPAAFSSTASIEILHVEGATFPPVAAQYSPWPSVRQFISNHCFVDVEKMPTILPNLRSCEFGDLTEPLWTLTSNFPLWKSLDHLELECPLSRWKWKGCTVRQLEVLTGLDYPTCPEDMLEVIDFLRETQINVLSLDQIDVQAGREFWSLLETVVPNLRCLKFAVVLTPDLNPVRVLVSDVY